ncbi:MAG: hypothetical protein LBD72_00005, partial [Puniceicoccales bacterium]|nr:hypothetical protein [Puniceicoccales bacterium]
AYIAFGNENKHSEAKRLVYEFILLLMGQDPDQFDAAGYTEACNILERWLHGAPFRKTPALESILVKGGFQKLKRYIKVIQDCVALNEQWMSHSVRVNYNDILDNSKYIHRIGHDEKLNKLYNYLVELQKELDRFDIGGRKMLDELHNVMRMIGVTIFGLRTDLLTFTFGPNRDWNYPITPCTGGQYLQIMYFMGYNMHLVALCFAMQLLNGTSMGTADTDTIFAYLFDRDVYIFNESHLTVNKIASDSIKVEDTHPNFGKIQALRQKTRDIIRAHEGPIYYTVKRVHDLLGHCYPNVPPKRH